MLPAPRTFLLPSCLVVLLLCLSAPVSAGPFFTGIGDLAGGAHESRASGISPDGRLLVGASQSDSGLLQIRWSVGGGMIPSGDLPGGNVATTGRDASYDGSVVAGDGSSGAGYEMATWTLGTGLVGRGDLPGGSVLGFGYTISDDGLVVVGSGVGDGFATQATRWTQAEGWTGLGFLGTATTGSQALGVSQDGAVIVGSSPNGVSGEWEAFRWTSATGMQSIGDLPGGNVRSTARGITPDGSTIVGDSSSTASAAGSAVNSEAFVYTGGAMTGLGDLPGGRFLSQASAVSADGSTIVGRGESDEGRRAVIWRDGGAPEDVKVVLTSLGLDLSGWTLTGVTGISANGRKIVGNGINPQGQPEGWFALVPEPSTGTLLCLGLLLGVARRR